MENEKRIWLIEQYAHKAWTVSLALSQEAARAGQHGKGYAVVAHEARILADKLFEYAGKVRFDGGDVGMFKGILDFAIMMKFLSVNAALETQRMATIRMDFNIPKSMSVFAEELRRIAVGLNELADKSVWQKPFTMPELAAPSKYAATESFFFYSISGSPLIENLRNIQEVCYPRNADINENLFSLRGLKIPLLNCYRRFGLPCASFDPDRHTVMIINPHGINYGSCDGLYAVPIDDLDVNAIFYSKTGNTVTPKKEHPLADYARECWDAVDGSQLILADWEKLIAE